MNRFELFFNEFKRTDVWSAMTQAVENSPWHRESSVSIHTEMVLDQYRTRFLSNDEDQDLVACIALLMHDTGKPNAEETLQKKDGIGTYHRYSNHEQYSANIFTECYLSMSTLRSLLTPEQARAARWIIEHHLPYGYKDKQKRLGLAQASRLTLAAAGVSYETFFSCLRADAAGRISDDHEKKLQDVETWISQFKELSVVESRSKLEQQKAFILVGPSGSGKSTWTKQHFNSSLDRVISMDAYRLELAAMHGKNSNCEVENYRLAWIYAVEHEQEFNAYLTKRMREDIAVTKQLGGKVFIDNTNNSRKSRAKWIEALRANNFYITGVEFWTTLETLSTRQGLRADKSVPIESVKAQRLASTCCWLGYEVDEVQLVLSS